jgi:hypothetical protein
MTSEDILRTTISLPANVKRGIEQAAKEDRRTMNAQIVSELEDCLERRRKRKKRKKENNKKLNATVVFTGPAKPEILPPDEALD